MKDVLCIYYSRTGNTKKAMEEIAAALEEPEAAVKSRYYRLIGRLRKEFGADG